MQQAQGQVFGRGHRIDASGIDGTLWHGGKRGGLGLLHQAQAARCVNGLHALHPIVAHARQNHPHSPILLVQRQRLQKVIDGPMQALRFGGHLKMQATALYGEFAAGGHHMHSVGFQHKAVVGVLHGQTGHGLQQRGQQGFVLRTGVLHHHKGQACVQGHMGEEFFQSVKPSG